MKIDPIYPELGKVIRHYRTLRGMTQYELADDVGCTRASIQMMERGSQRIHLDVLMRIADALDTNVATLLSWILR